MYLTDLDEAILLAVHQLTRDSYGDTDGASVMAALRDLGRDEPEYTVDRAARRLRDDGYLTAHFGGGSFVAAAGLIGLTRFGQETVADLAVDRVQRNIAATRRLLASETFVTQFGAASERWADADRLLWGPEDERELTTIGHKIREAMQEFASELVRLHAPPDVDENPAHARARLGAVIALHREQLGEARREALEALGNLWEVVDKLAQRQEHGASKEGAELGFSDARRLVVLTMFLMVEFAETFDDLNR